MNLILYMEIDYLITLELNWTDNYRILIIYQFHYVSKHLLNDTQTITKFYVSVYEIKKSNQMTHYLISLYFIILYIYGIKIFALNRNYKIRLVLINLIAYKQLKITSLYKHLKSY